MAKNNTFPIGIFDSGLGGLSIYKEISTRLPAENIIYLADSKNAPYGEKSNKRIIEISKKNTEFLRSKNAKLIVVACNTATTNAIDILRTTYDIPFIGIEPAIKPAILNSKKGKVGVLATKGTLSSALFARTSKLFSEQSQVVEVVGRGIVEAIESNASDTDSFDDLLKTQLRPFIAHEIDILVLGCSHYPFIKSKIQKHLGEEVLIIDSGFAVAKQTQRILELHSLINSGNRNEAPALTEIYTNGTNIEALMSITKQLNINNYLHKSLHGVQ
jgi:glutamate racemase